MINFVFLRIILCKKYNAIIMGKNATINSRNTTKSVSNTKNKSAAVSKQVEGKSFNFNRWQQLLNVVSVLVFSLLAFYILAIKNNQFLIRAQELDLFIPKMFFLRNNMDVPGGLLTWLGSFFSQFFYYPWLGSSVFILFALLLQFSVVKAFKIQSKHFLITSIIPFSILLTLTQTGYLIYTLKSPGFMYSSLLGFIAVALSFYLYRALKDIRTKTLFALLFPLFFYPLLGFFALFATLLFVLREFFLYINDRQIYRFFVISAGLLSAIVIPRLMFGYVYPQLHDGKIYTSILPRISLESAEKVQWLPYLFVIGFMVLALLFATFKKKTEPSVRSLFLGLMVFVVSIYVFDRLNFDDENFNTEIAMDLAVFDNRWDDILELSKEHKDEPTRWIVMNRNLALQKLGRAGDEMFTFENGEKLPNTPWPTRLLVLAGKPMFYQYGKINYCYHWAMEAMVERGMKVEYLQYMVKCSLIKAEFKLAQKYNNMLKLTLFHKAWAEKYQQYIDNPPLMLDDPEFRAIQPFTAYNDHLQGDNGILEVELVNFFASTDLISKATLDVSIQSTLLLKSSELFWPRFMAYLQLNPQASIPIHYQEAALMFAFFEKKINVDAVKFNPAVLNRFNSFAEMIKLNQGNTKEMNRALFKPMFGDTYWHHYFFSKQLRTF